MVAAVPELVDRHAELSAIDHALAGAGDGAGLLIAGPPGIGKTSLLTALAERAERAGDSIRRARGGELERAFAYGIVRQLFETTLHAAGEEERSRYLAGAARPAAAILGGDVGSPPDSAAAAHHALYWLAANLASEQRLAVIVDDAQWSDTASLHWLVHLARRLAGLPILLAVGWRTGEPGSADEVLDVLRACPAMAEITPQPLGRGGVAELAGQVLGARATEVVVESATAATGGNPFLLVELLRGLGAGGAFGEAAGEAMTLETVARSVRQRIGRVGADAERVAEAAAILGRDADLHHVGALAELDTQSVAAAADGLVAAHVLAPETPLRFTHPLVRAAVYGQVPANRRAVAHHEAARRLDAEAAPRERVAVHLAASAPSGDEWTATVLDLAGRDALRRGASEEAEVLFSRALAEPPPSGHRAALLHALGQALELRSAARALPHLGEAMALTPDVRDRARIARDIASCEMQLANGPGRAVELLDANSDAVAAIDRELYLELEADRASAAFTSVDLAPAAGRRLERVAADLAGSTPAERRLLGCLSYRHALEATASADEAARLASLALRELPATHDVAAAAFSLMQPMLVLIVTDHVEEARDLLGSGIALGRETGSLSMVGLFTLLRCYQRALVGELLESEADGWTASAIGAEAGAGKVAVAAYLGRTLVDRGRLAEAEELIAPDDPETRALSMSQMRNPYLATIAHLRREQARWSEALAAEQELAGRLAEAGATNPSLPWRNGAAIALTALGQHEEARTLAAEQRAIATSWGVRRAVAAALRAQGVAEGGERGATLLGEACELFAVTPARLEHARALLDLGAALRRANRRVESRDPLRAALDLAHRCGATLVAKRAEEELRATGARPRKLVLSGAESLTASERRVCVMAADGLSNPQIAQALFVTRNTIEAHLRSAFRKLDVTRREQLRDALSEPPGSNGD